MMYQIGYFSIDIVTLFGYGQRTSRWCGHGGGQSLRQTPAPGIIISCRPIAAAHPPSGCVARTCASPTRRNAKGRKARSANTGGPISSRHWPRPRASPLRRRQRASPPAAPTRPGANMRISPPHGVARCSPPPPPLWRRRCAMLRKVRRRFCCSPSRRQSSTARCPRSSAPTCRSAGPGPPSIACSWRITTG